MLGGPPSGPGCPPLQREKRLTPGGAQTRPWEVLRGTVCWRKAWLNVNMPDSNLSLIASPSLPQAPRLLSILAHSSVSHRTAGGLAVARAGPLLRRWSTGQAAGGGGRCPGASGGCLGTGSWREGSSDCLGAGGRRGGGHCLGNSGAREPGGPAAPGCARTPQSLAARAAGTGCAVQQPDRTSCRPHPSAERDGEPGSGQGLAGGAGSSPRPPCSRACFLFPPMSRHAGSTHARAHGRNDSPQRPMKRAGCASRPATPAAVLPPTVTAGLPLRTGGRRSRASPQRHWSAALGRIRRFPGAPVPRGGSELCWRMGTCPSPPRASWEAPPAQGPLGLGAAGTVPAACQGRTPGRTPA